MSSFFSLFSRALTDFPLCQSVAAWGLKHQSAAWRSRRSTFVLELFWLLALGTHLARPSQRRWGASVSLWFLSFVACLRPRPNKRVFSCLTLVGIIFFFSKEHLISSLLVMCFGPACWTWHWVHTLLPQRGKLFTTTQRNRVFQLQWQVFFYKDMLRDKLFLMGERHQRTDSNDGSFKLSKRWCQDFTFFENAFRSTLSI